MPIINLDDDITTESTEPQHNTPLINEHTAEVSGSRGPASAEATPPPELPDHPRHPSPPPAVGTHKGLTTCTPNTPEDGRDRQGPVSAEAKVVPELADNPCHLDRSGRGTHKGSTRSPLDAEGVKKPARPLMAPVFIPYHRKSTRSTISKPSVELKINTNNTPKDDEESKLDTRRYPKRIRSAPDRYCPCLPRTKNANRLHRALTEAEATNADVYDRMVQKRDGRSSIPVAGTSHLRPRRLAHVPHQRAADCVKDLSGHSRSSNLGVGLYLPLASDKLTIASSGALSCPFSEDSSKDVTRGHTVFAVQWNMNGYLNNLPDLEMLVNRHHPVVIALQEIHRTNVATMNNTLRRQYRWYTKTGANIYQSAGIGISAEIPADQINIETDLPIVGVRIPWPFPVSVVSLYLPNGKLVNLKKSLEEIFRKIPGPLIVMGDVNGHHKAWGSPHNNTRGSIVAALANQLDLIILNDGSTTFSRGRSETVVDVSLASAAITHRLLWSAEPDLRGSDHTPIFLKLDSNATPETSRRPRWLFETADWLTYRSVLDEKLNSSPPESIQDFINHISSTSSETIPRTSPNPGRRALHWWTSETCKTVKLRRKTLRVVQKLRKKISPDHPDLLQALEQYHTARNTCRQIIREAKEKSWTEFLDGINEDESASELWRRINCFQGKRRSRGIALMVDDCLSRDPAVIADALADYFHDISSYQHYPDGFRIAHPTPDEAIRRFVVPPDRGQDFNVPFTFNELEFALKRAKGKSAGPDDIGYPMLKNLPLNGKLVLLDMLNRLWTTETLPESWKHSFMIAIPKNTGPASDAKSYRPIALKSCVVKIMERIVNRRLVGFLEDNQLLDSRQHAFRPGFGTGTYLASLGQILDEALKTGEHVELASLDLAKAYNRTWTPGILQKLVNMGISGNMLAFVRNFLEGRTFQVLVGNHRSKIVQEETGVPQGSVLAVTLFLVAMNGVFLVLPKGVFILVYADDILLLVRGKHPKMIRRKLQAAVSAVAKWATQVGFDMAADKCVRVHVCDSKHRPPGKINIQGLPIPTRNYVKILGVTIDRNLSFHAHFTAVKSACKTRISMIQSISGKRTRSERTTRKRVAEAVVNSRLLYGIEISGRSFDDLVKTLSPTYNNCVRALSGLLPSTPAVSACVEAGILPFQYKATMALCCRAVGYLERTVGRGQDCFLTEQANRALREVANATLPSVVELHRVGPRSWSAKEITVDKTIKNHFRRNANPVAVQGCFLERLSEAYSNAEVYYTDGSKLANRVGVGVFGSDTEISLRLPSQCTVFTAESAAIYLAAKKQTDRMKLIVSDSASAITAICSDTNKHPFIQAAQNLLANTKKQATLMWVPSHCGILGNEHADRLAAMGRQEALLTPKVPGDDVKSWVKTMIKSAWALKWDRDRSLFLRRIKADTALWTDIPNWREQKVLSRLRTGHSRLSYNMSGSGSFRKTCDICKVHNTTEHIISCCPKYDLLRRQHDITSTSRALQNNSVYERTLINFLREAGLFLEI